MTALAHGAASPGVQLAMSALDAVCDPEIPVVTLRELGILRAVSELHVDGMTVIEVQITPTYSGCPAMEQIRQDIAMALQGAGIQRHQIRTVLAPAWRTDWITPEARDKLRAYGIAPPAWTGDDASAPKAASHVIRFSAGPDRSTPACPQCGSPNTECIAQHGSTACKALYRCLSCREPFDYFKPY